MEFKNWFQSKTATNVLIVVGIIIVVLVIFEAGIFVGFHKASFSYRLGENYYQTFGGPRGDFGEIAGNGFPNTNGVNGKIIKINLPSIVIEDQTSIERVVVITDDTSIRKFREEIKPEDLKVGDYVVIIGSPNDSAQTEAHLIRLIPPPPNQSNLATTSTMR